MRLLVTGASGKLGAPLVRALLAAGAGPVRTLSRSPAADRTPGVEAWRGDLLEPASLAGALDGVERVVHAAACTHSARAARYFEVNERGTAHLIEAALAAGVRDLVLVSTRALGDAGGAYSASKARAEELVRASRLRWTILRPGEVFGGGGRDPLRELVAGLRRRRAVTLLGNGSCELSPVFVDDVVAAIVRAAVGEVRGATYTLAGPESMTQLELVRRAEAFLGLAPRRRVRLSPALARAVIALAAGLGLGPYVPDQVPRFVLSKSADIEAARRDLAFRPRRFEEGLAALFPERASARVDPERARERVDPERSA